jgi:predicted ATPase
MAGYTVMRYPEIRTQLPQEPNSFVGRERELTELCQLVGVTRALTLCGPGGIGKTRLAQQILHALAGAFPDGGCFVELGDLWQPDLVVSRVASALGVDEEPGRPLLETLADAVASRRLLIVLDNCEHLIEACARICHRLLDGSQGLALIATSREPLRVAAETVWQVPPLSVAPAGLLAAAEDVYRYEAIRLFAERAAASLPGFRIGPANAGAVAAL